MTWAFLIDANLPVALARAIAALGHAAVHVTDIGANDRDDLGIWDLAIARNEVVITKDSDFADIVVMSETRQAVVWLQIGNTRKLAIITKLTAALPDILAALDAGERLIEVR